MSLKAGITVGDHAHERQHTSLVYQLYMLAINCTIYIYAFV